MCSNNNEMICLLTFNFTKYWKILNSPGSVWECSGISHCWQHDTLRDMLTSDVCWLLNL
jgi:hypothetical protein